MAEGVTVGPDLAQQGRVDAGSDGPPQREVYGAVRSRGSRGEERGAGEGAPREPCPGPGFLLRLLRCRRALPLSGTVVPMREPGLLPGSRGSARGGLASAAAVRAPLPGRPAAASAGGERRGRPRVKTALRPCFQRRHGTVTRRRAGSPPRKAPFTPCLPTRSAHPEPPERARRWPLVSQLSCRWTSRPEQGGAGVL